MRRHAYRNLFAKRSRRHDCDEKVAASISAYFDISSIRSIGLRARSITSAGSSIFGSRFSRHANSFSGVFISMFRQCWLSFPEDVAAINVLSGISRRRRCIISTTVAIMNLSLGFSRQNEIIFFGAAHAVRSVAHRLRAFGVADERSAGKGAF